MEVIAFVLLVIEHLGNREKENRREFVREETRHRA